MLTNPHQRVPSSHFIEIGKLRSIQVHRFVGRRFVYGLRLCVDRAGVGVTSLCFWIEFSRLAQKWRRPRIPNPHQPPPA